MKSKPATKSSDSSRRSKGAGPRAAAPSRLAPLSVFLVLALLSFAAAHYVFSQGWTLWYGDAQAHLNIARRIFDARVPGYRQIGTVWLPLPHLLMMPFARIDEWWRNGLAGVFPVTACFVLGGLFLFLALRRIFGAGAPAFAGVAVYALNPNLLYLQSTPMTEPVSMACLFGLLWFCARFRDSRSLWDAAFAGVMATLGCMTRYDVWPLLPLAAFYFLIAGGKRRWLATLLFTAIATLGPLYWLAHNWFLYSNPLEFYDGPWSAKAIYQRALDQGMARYPGDHDWRKALEYYRAAVVLCLGLPLRWLTVAGVVAAFFKRAWWAVLLLAAVPMFYVLSLYSSGTPIFVPHLWPNSYYNTRYGLAALPLAALSTAALVALVPGRLRSIAAVLLAAISISPWVFYPRMMNWVCWKESEVNSAGRRAWTAQAAEYLKPRYKPSAGILMSFGDLTGILRDAGIPLAESLHEGDEPLWAASVARPDLFMWQEWAIAISGDRVSQAVNKLRRGPRRYECVRIYAVKGSPVVEIWRHIQ